MQEIHNSVDYILNIICSVINIEDLTLSIVVCLGAVLLIYLLLFGVNILLVFLINLGVFDEKE